MDGTESDVGLRAIDEQILALPEAGRCTRLNLAEQRDVIGEYVYQRIDLLHKLGFVHIVHDGFYERNGDVT